ncbi:BspA family leucine-rich repeat surface protein [Tenacibaculum sp. Ill]|uniref:BspA family leucine-rich repeat surface protein n=1 Tax=Tenacibaculum sp. Ill TaxID=3445935 RepID=UPI003F7991C5
MKSFQLFIVSIFLLLISCTEKEDLEQVKYEITFESNGGSVVANQLLEKGRKVKKPVAPIKEGYNFVNWYKEKSLIEIFDFDNEKVYKDITLYAKWDKINYSVNFESNGGTPINSQSVAYGNKVIKPTAPTKAGNIFVNWYKEAELKSVYDFNEIITENITLYAKWSKSYTVTFDLNGGTGTEIDKQNIEEGEKVVKPTSDSKLYCLEFNGWHTKKDSDSPFDFSTTINEDLILYARYTNSSFKHNPNTKEELQYLVDNKIDLSTINTCAITNMANLFENKTSTTDFNGSISNWNVSNVTSMYRMFNNASGFNQNINSWDVSSVTIMQAMFQKASSFNQPLDKWNVSNVRNMSVMFREAFVFNQNINSWNVSNVTNMEAMFQSAVSFNQPLDNWDISKLTSLDQVFAHAKAFNQNINSWNVSNITSMEGTFSIASSFNQPLDSWDVSNVTHMHAMFRSAEKFNQDISSWDVSNVVNMSSMFSRAKAFNKDINLWNVSKVTRMSNLFAWAKAFNQDLSKWDVSNVTDMSRMFKEASSFNQNISTWDVSSVTDMEEMFFNGRAFNQSEIKSWNIQSNTIINRMLWSTSLPETFRFDNLPDKDPF